MTPGPLTVAIPTAVQAAGEAQEMPDNQSTPLGTFSDVHVAPPSEVATSAAGPLTVPAIPAALHAVTVAQAIEESWNNPLGAFSVPHFVPPSLVATIAALFAVLSPTAVHTVAELQAMEERNDRAPGAVS
jgi:hypothetical protein